MVALAYSGGVLFVAQNPSRSLQKISELYDPVGVAAAWKYDNGCTRALAFRHYIRKDRGLIGVIIPERAGSAIRPK